MVYIDYRACITIIVHRIASAVQRQRRTTIDNNRQDQEARRTTETSANKGRWEEKAEMIKGG